MYTIGQPLPLTSTPRCSRQSASRCHARGPAVAAKRLPQHPMQPTSSLSNYAEANLSATATMLGKCKTLLPDTTPSKNKITLRPAFCIAGAVVSPVISSRLAGICTILNECLRTESTQQQKAASEIERRMGQRQRVSSTKTIYRALRQCRWTLAKNLEKHRPPLVMHLIKLRLQGSCGTWRFSRDASDGRHRVAKSTFVQHAKRHDSTALVWRIRSHQIKRARPTHPTISVQMLSHA